MTKKEARKLVKERGTTRLSRGAFAVLGVLINSTFLGKGASPETDMTGKVADVRVWTIAKSIGAKSDRTVYRAIAELENLHLITSAPKGNESVYTVTLDPMRLWDKGRFREDTQEARRIMRRLNRDTTRAGEQAQRTKLAGALVGVLAATGLVSPAMLEL